MLFYYFPYKTDLEIWNTMIDITEFPVACAIDAVYYIMQITTMSTSYIFSS
jgi:hypothetical protein